MKKTAILTIIIFCACAMPAHALDEETEPYQFSLFYPLQTSHPTKSIHGFRLNLVSGKNKDVSGLDMGMINLVEREQSGLQFGFYNSAFKATGIQFGLVNRAAFLDGLQIGLLNFHEEGDWRLLPIVNFAF